MLPERATALQHEMDELAQLRESVAEREVISTRAEQLSSSARVIGPLWEVAQVLRSRDHPVEIETANPRRLHAELSGLLSAMGESPGVLAQAETLREPLRFLELLGRQLQGATHDAWRAYTQSRSVVVDKAVLDVLACLPGFEKQIERVRGLLVDLAERVALPSGETEIKAFDRVAEQLHKAWTGIRGDDIPEAVMGFLRAAGTEGAALSMLTPDVTDWLHDNKLEGAFHVVVG